jgi:O-antigen/teichoic acid export membrane protein
MASARQDLLLNGLAVVARLGSAMVLFVLLGRWLGPQDFGNLMAAFAAATLFAFLASLGLTQQALREMAVPGPGQDGVASALLSAKLALSVATVALALAAGLALGGPAWVFTWLCLAVVAEGWIEFLFAMLKARGRYGAEAGFQAVAATLHLGIVAAVCSRQPAIEPVALAFAASRALQLVGALWVSHRAHPLPRPTRQWRSLRQQLRRGGAYTADVGLSVLAQQLDTLIVRAWLGAQAAGLYQAGMRVVLGMQSLSVIAGNVFIPRLTKSLQDKAGHAQVLRELRRAYAALALLAAAGVWLLGSLLTRYGYGAAFAELGALWPWLAALIGLRMLAAHHGVRLTALGRQALRTRVNALGLLLSMAALLLALQLGAGLVGVVLALIAGTAWIWFAFRRAVLRVASP